MRKKTEEEEEKVEDGVAVRGRWPPAKDGEMRWEALHIIGAGEYLTGCL